MKKETPKVDSFPPSADLALDNIYIYIYIYILYINLSQKRSFFPFRPSSTVVGSHSVGLGTGDFLWLHGAVSPGFTPFRGGLLPEAPLIREMPMEPKVFLAIPNTCGLRPEPTFKKALCHICPVEGRMINTEVVLDSGFLEL